jgi:proline iminopeptidase
MQSILPELQRLGDSHTIIFYDQRGGGRSELPADTTLLGAREHVQDLDAVRRFFGLERMALVAFSFGSVLVARYAEEYPDRVARLAFFGAVGPHRVAAAQQAQAPLLNADSVTQARFRTVLRTLLEGSAPDPVAACQQYETLGREMAMARGESARWRGTTCAMPPDAVRYYYRYTARLSPQDFGVWDFRRSLRNFEFPLLVITGARDSVSLDLNRDWACAVRHGRLLIIPGAGKTASADRPDLFFPAVERFLAGHWPAGAIPCRATGPSPGVR